MEKNLRVYRKMKRVWMRKIGGNQEKLKAYQMLYTLPSGFTINLVLGFFNILEKWLKCYVPIVVLLIGLLCFYLLYKEKKRQEIRFILKEIEDEIFQDILEK